MSTKQEKVILGIIGTGRIARRFTKMVMEQNSVIVGCIYNPHLESARRMAEEYNISNYTDNWDAFIIAIDAAYVASPHQTHGDYIRRLLKRGKHVLCEKPMCFDEEEAKSLYAYAKQQGCILEEAIKTAYCPGFLAMMEKTANGVIGDVKDVEACFSRLTPTNLREYTDTQWGGSLTEFGSYVLLPVFRLLGTDYEKLNIDSICAANGVDSYTRLCFTYEQGMATVKTGLGVKTEGQLVISGTKGYILCESPWWLTKKFEIRYEDPNEREVYEYPYEESGLQYELEAFVQKIQETGKKSNVGVTQTESIAMAGVMEVFLNNRSGGFKNNGEDKDSSMGN